MADFEDILAVKKATQRRLLAIPGVHSVAIGAKVVGGKRTTEPSIVVFVVKKKDPSELSPDEIIPSEINGVKTDVVEEEIPQLFAGSLPDENHYDVMEGGIQVQGGTTVTGKGTLGCIARTDEPNPRIMGITCQHVFAMWSGQDIGLKTSANSKNKYETFIYGSNIAGSRVRCSIDLTPTGAGAPQSVGPLDYITTNADTLGTIASNVAAAINGAGNPNVTANSKTVNLNNGPGASVTVVPGAGFDAAPEIRTDIMWATTAAGNKVVTFQGTVLPGLMAKIDVLIVPIPTGDFQYLDIFYTAVAGDTLHSIAGHLADLINGLGNAGVTAAGPTLPAGSEVTITSGANAVATIWRTAVYLQMQVDPDSKLKGDISGNVITLSGQVSGDDYGIYTNVNPGGQPPSSGVFFRPDKNGDLSTIATGIVGYITSQNIPGITASASGAQITVVGAEELQCAVTSDIRVGQPINDFPSSCSKCCDKRVGRISDARLQLDTALIQLDPGVKYKAEIAEIGLVAGDYAVTDGDVVTANTYQVQKRGRTTGWTKGTIQYLHADGDIGEPQLFHRHYTDAIKITGNKFSAPGDSGSAVLNAANEVVGILFGGGTTTTYATPIQTITSALNIIIESTTVANDVKTVPAIAPADAMSIPESSVGGAAAAPNINRLGVNWDLLREAEQELTATPAGSKLATILRNHIPETQRLISNNPRFAGIWQTHGGPQIVQSILRMAQFRDQRLPETIDGRPLIECLQIIKKVLLRYASPELSSDLQRHESLIEGSLNLTYSDLLVTLRTLRVE